MAGSRYSTGPVDGNGFGPKDGPKSGRRIPLPAIVAAAAVVLVALFTAAGLILATGGGPGGSSFEERAPLPNRPAPGEPTPTPTPRPEFTSDVASIEAVAESVSAVVESPTTAASSWTMSPAPPSDGGGAPAASGAAALAAEANATYGINILIEGQDWGEGEAAQEANVGAVISAVQSLPQTVISAVVAHPAGPLTFVSNNHGRTLGGWQPYGSHPMTYYTNSDQGAGGYQASNQVVLSVGAGSMSIAHEILHAYQNRNVGPDEYALALLQPEMRSFMKATGWRQVGTDAQVRAAVNQPWSALNALYVYEGRALTYTGGNGGTAAMTADNPVEAFAIAGSVYYTRPAWMQQPDWPEYWAWFEKNVG
jgi:hypothetical protein